MQGLMSERLLPILPMSGDYFSLIPHFRFGFYINLAQPTNTVFATTRILFPSSFSRD